MTIHEDNRIDGVGPDVEVVSNENGGLQSKAIGYFHYVDPMFMYGYFKKYYREAAHLVTYLKGEDTIEGVVTSLCFYNPNTLIDIAKTMEYGATKGNNGKGYPKDNWRLIPVEDHINHALIHLFAAERGDTQDDHMAHFYTRLMMAYGVTYQDKEE